MIKCLRVLLCLLPMLFPILLCAQDFTLEMLHNSRPTNLRGFCPLDSNMVWVCGNNGSIGSTIDGGKNWEWTTPKGFEKADFRDIVAFDAKKVVVMASGTPAVILRTEDGGSSWKEVFRSDDTAIFLDALDFWNENEGVCLGDWVESRPYMLSTIDGGRNWKKVKAKGKKFTEKTASFAASGTCLRLNEIKGEKEIAAAIVTGKKHGLITGEFDASNNVFEYNFDEAPYIATAETQGIFSLCLDTAAKTMWLAGGDYAQRAIGYNALMVNGAFITPASQVNGYRSCIELFYQNNTAMVIACGLNGTDITLASEPKWKNISLLPMNTAIRAKNDNSVFLCGPNGTIFRLREK